MDEQTPRMPDWNELRAAQVKRTEVVPPPEPGLSLDWNALRNSLALIGSAPGMIVDRLKGEK